MVLHRWKSSVESLSHSFCTQTLRAWEEIRETRSQALTPTVYHLPKSEISEDYLVRGSPLRRKQIFKNQQQPAIQVFLCTPQLHQSNFTAEFEHSSRSQSHHHSQVQLPSSSSSAFLCLDKWFKSTAGWFIKTYAVWERNRSLLPRCQDKPWQQHPGMENFTSTPHTFLESWGREWLYLQ